MSAVEGSELDISGASSCAADAGHDRHLIQIKFTLFQRVGERSDHRADAATGAPDVRDTVHPEEILHRVPLFYGFLCFHRAASLIAFRMSSGSWTQPPQWGTPIAGDRPKAQRSTSRRICPRLISGTCKTMMFY